MSDYVQYSFSRNLNDISPSEPELPKGLGDADETFRCFLASWQQWRESDDVLAFDKRVSSWWFQQHRTPLLATRPVFDDMGFVRLGRLGNVCHFTSPVAMIVLIWQPYFALCGFALSQTEALKLQHSPSFELLRVICDRSVRVEANVDSAVRGSKFDSGVAYGARTARLHSALLAASQLHRTAQHECVRDERLDVNLLEGTIGDAAESARAIVRLIFVCHQWLAQRGLMMPEVPTSLTAFAEATGDSVPESFGGASHASFTSRAKQGGIVRVSSLAANWNLLDATMVQEAIDTHSPVGVTPVAIMFQLCGREHFFTVSRLRESNQFLVDNDETCHTVCLSSWLLPFAVPVLVGFPTMSTGVRQEALSVAISCGPENVIMGRGLSGVSHAVAPTAATHVTAGVVSSSDMQKSTVHPTSSVASDFVHVVNALASPLASSSATVSTTATGFSSVTPASEANSPSEAAPLAIAASAAECDTLSGNSAGRLGSDHRPVLHTDSLLWTDDDRVALRAVRNNGTDFGVGGRLRGNMCGWTSVIRQIPRALLERYGIRSTGDLQSCVWRAMSDASETALAVQQWFSDRQAEDSQTVPDFFGVSSVAAYLQYVSSHDAEMTELELHGVAAFSNCAC